MKLDRQDSDCAPQTNLYNRPIDNGIPLYNNDRPKAQRAGVMLSRRLISRLSQSISKVMIYVALMRVLNRGMY